MSKDVFRTFVLVQVVELWNDRKVRTGGWLGNYRSVDDCLKEIFERSGVDLGYLKSNVEDELFGIRARHYYLGDGVTESESLVLWELTRNHTIKNGYLIRCLETTW